MKGILFDLDNTLIDWATMKHKACDAALTAMIDAGLKMTHSNAKKILFEMYEKYGIENQTIFNKFLKKINGQIDYRILSEGIAAYRIAKNELLIPYPLVRETLQELTLKKIKLGIVSDAPRMNAWMRLAEMQLCKYFDIVITLDDTNEFKPSPKGFKKALNSLGLNAKEVMFVGDNPERDIKGANALGLTTVLAKYGQVFKGKEKADFEINNISELINIVQKKTN
jgi:putative hydrolase of the HAD superfamily